MNNIQDYQMMDATEMESFYDKLPISIVASVYRMSAGNAYYKQPRLVKSPWDYYIKNTNSSNSSLTSFSSSSRSNSPEPMSDRDIDMDDDVSPPRQTKKHNKKSYQMLMREIRRLRNENNSLKNGILILKNDLRDINLSRQDTDASHKKFYEEAVDKNTQLEIDIEDKNDEIEQLKKQIEELKKCHQCHVISQHKFSCFDNPDDYLYCQPIADETCLPEIDIKMDEFNYSDDEQTMNDYMKRYEEDNEEEEDEEEVTESSFEDMATIYIQQAIISKLSSARVKLEFDDLIVKYEPSSDKILSVLCFTFLDWISSLLTKFNHHLATTKIFTNHIEAGITNFWESILQYYTSGHQLQLLNLIESNSQHISSSEQISKHFDRLVLILYKYHVIDYDAVIDWWQHPFETDKSKSIRKITTRFIEWLQDSDEEEDEDEEEEDDDNDEEESEFEDDDSSIFSFVESSASEDQSELISDNELETNPIDDLLVNQNREFCVCQLDTTSTSPPPPKKIEPCSCTIHTPPVIEKKKKSVRIAM